jgi:ribonucleoside-diphosphate reductase alpha chain
MLHFRAWELGIKSLYYLRSKSVQRAGFAGGVEAGQHAGAQADRTGEHDYDECLACQ